MDNTLFSPRAQNKFNLKSSTDLSTSIDIVWQSVSNLGKLISILHPNGSCKMNGDGKDMVVLVTEGEAPTWTAKVFELNIDKKKMTFIIKNEIFAAYKCTVTVSAGEDEKCHVTFLEVGRMEGTEEYDELEAKKRIESFQNHFKC